MVKMGKAQKYRTQVNISERIVQQIDEAVGPRKRSEFLERAALELLREGGSQKMDQAGGEVPGADLRRYLLPF
jgi:metal-responsive CopG/Arc/MetJ family transcriptional regulator